MKKINTVLISMLLSILLIVNINEIYASNTTVVAPTPNQGGIYNSTGNILQDIISQGNRFQNSGGDTGLGSSIANYITGDIKTIVSVIGNLIFAAVTVILGAKYIWSGVEGRSQVKETLPNFIAAVLFFYLAVEITGLFSPKTSGSIGSELGGVTDYNSLALKIIGTVNTVVKYASFAGVVFVGLRYMFASAEGKSQIKDSLVPMTLGVVLVFAATTVVDFIIKVGGDIL